MSEELDEILNIFETAANIGLGVANYQQAKSNAIASQNTAIKLNEKKIQAQATRDSLNFAKTEAKDLYDDNMTEINNSIKELELWSLNAEDLVSLDNTKWATDESKKMLQDRGIELGSDLRVRYAADGNIKESINSIQIASELQKEVINQLNDRLRTVNSATQHFENIGVEEGIPLVQDVDDFIKYMDDNPEMFPEDDPNSPLNEGYLRQAFTSNKMLNMPLDAKKNAVALSTQIMNLNKKVNEGDTDAATDAAKELKALNEKVRKNDNQAIRNSFNAIEGFETLNEEVQNIYNDARLTPIGPRKGDNFAWIDDPSEAADIASTVGQNIVKLLSWGRAGNTQENAVLANLVNKGNASVAEQLNTVYKISQLIMPNETYKLTEVRDKDGNIVNQPNGKPMMQYVVGADGEFEKIYSHSRTGSGLNNSLRDITLGFNMYDSGQVDDKGEPIFTGAQKVNIKGFRNLDIDLEKSGISEVLPAWLLPKSMESTAQPQGGDWLGVDVSVDDPMGEQLLVEHLKMFRKIVDMNPELKLAIIQEQHKSLDPSMKGKKINPYAIIKMGYTSDQIQDFFEPEELDEMFDKEAWNGILAKKMNSAVNINE